MCPGAPSVSIPRSAQPQLSSENLPVRGVPRWTGRDERLGDVKARNNLTLLIPGVVAPNGGERAFWALA